MTPLSPVAKQLIYIALGSFVVQAILEVWVGFPISALLALQGGPPVPADLWRLVTYPLVWGNGPGAVYGLAFACLGFWWMVSPIEASYGARRTWAFVIFTIVATALPVRLLGFVLPGIVLVGAGVVFTAAISVFAFTYRGQVLRLFGLFAVQAMHLLYFIVGFSMLQFLMSRNLGQLAADLAAIGAGWWFVQRGGDVVPSIGAGGRRKPGKRKRRGNLRVVGEDDDPPRWLN